MNLSYSLRRITCAGSKGMISARNIKAPHFVLRRNMLRLYSIYEERKTALEASRIPFGGQRYSFFVGNDAVFLRC